MLLDLCEFLADYFYDRKFTKGPKASRTLNFSNNFFYICSGKKR